MNEAEKKLRKRRRHIKQATDVNRKHADMMKTESIARHKRSRILKKENEFIRGEIQKIDRGEFDDLFDITHRYR